MVLVLRRSVKCRQATLNVGALCTDGGKEGLVGVTDSEKLELDRAPPLTLISPTTKLLVAALEVKVIASVESFEVAPSETSAEVMAILGPVVS